MPSPSTSLATLRPDIAGSVEAFDLVAGRNGFIGDRLFPIFPVAQQAGTFGKIPLEQLLRTASTRRTSRSAYPRGDWQFTTDTYATEEHGWEEPVDERDAKLYANYFDAEMVSAELARDMVLRNREIRIAALIAALTPTAVGTEWSNHASATPITDVKASKRRVFAACGLWPNSLTVSYAVFENLRLCAQIQEAIESAGAGSATKQSDITAALLAQVFDLDEVIVAGAAGAAKNTAAEGQSAVIAEIWDDEYAMVAKVARTNNIKEPCLGRTMHWDADGSTPGGTFESYRDERVRGDVIRCRQETHEKVIMSQCADLLSNITA